MLKYAAAALAAVVLSVPALAGPWEDGVEAYRRGDYATAVRLMLPLAEEGDVAAQYNLGIAYARGLGVKADYAQATRWFRRAAEHGAALAQFNLGVIYQRGLGVAQDHAEAARWYRLAAEGDEPRAQLEIGLKLASGEGVPPDYVRAHMWLNLAASQGEANAAMHRDIVAKKMTAGEIAEAVRLAHAWQPRPDR